MSQLPDISNTTLTSTTPPQPLRILVVDDHADSANALVKLLSASGYAAQAAYGYADAFTRCRTCPFDLLITDIRLQDGDGIQLLHSLPDHALPPCAIALSGSDDDDDRSRAHLAGFADYLLKPFPLPALLDRVAQLRPPLNP